MYLDVDQMPGIVFEYYSGLLDNTEVVPSVSRESGGQILLIHESDRIRMTIRFQLSSGHRWIYKKSTLHIDGEKTQVASTPEMYYAIFKDPDNGRRNFVPKNAQKAVIPKATPIDEGEVPLAISRSLKELRKIVPEDATLSIGCTNENRYLITVTATSGNKVVYEFTNSTLHDIKLVSHTGYDVTSVYDSMGNDFIVEFLGQESRSAQRPSNPAGTEHTSGFASNAVQTRKATVFRI